MVIKVSRRIGCVVHQYSAILQPLIEASAAILRIALHVENVSKFLHRKVKVWRSNVAHGLLQRHSFNRRVVRPTQLAKLLACQNTDVVKSIGPATIKSARIYVRPACKIVKLSYRKVMKDTQTCFVGPRTRQRTREISA